ncbi:MAG: T9SS type A sorting domain-containing protein [Bacteroidales bacterium]|nr:T9SS type A sorting domain-containing protein [Bacteroidales bacterium]
MISLQSNMISGCRSSFTRTASVFLFLAMLLPAKSQVITVKQDGTGDFTIIQEAIATSENGDTIIVYPGTYYENLDLTNKGIVLASTWIYAHEDSLISQTVIDGNHSGSCIRSLSGNLWTSVIGLTIQNGFGTNHSTLFPWAYGNGGGILLEDSKMNVYQCRITNNYGQVGGGIYSTESSLELSGNTISNNWAQRAGGGLCIGFSLVNLDSLNLNNIYLNYSASGSDIAIYYNDTPSKIWLDTATVLNPDQYYIGKFNNRSVHIPKPPVSVLHGKIEQVNADLFVSPEGNNNNSGLTINDPLKTISYALLKITTDSINIKTIHVAEGVYSNILNGEHTPIQLKNYVNLIGQGMENTIIDCEDKYEGARFAFGQEYTKIKNITIRNGNGYFNLGDGGISSGYSRKLIMDSVAIKKTTGFFFTGMYSDSDDTILMKNCVFENCEGYKTSTLFVNYDQAARYSEFISCRFSGNRPDSAKGGLQTCLNLQGMSYPHDLNLGKIINCLFDDNLDTLHWSGNGGAAAVDFISSKWDIINTTFAYNLTVNNPGGGAIGVMDGSVVNLHNCLLYGNESNQINLTDFQTDAADTVNIGHSLVQNGQEGIVIYGENDRLFWGGGNLDANPLFFGSGEHPYSIDFGSPCIDAGTLDLPPGITLPEFDIAGNPRVYGNGIDMGAYEYGPWVGVPAAPGSRFQVPGSKLLNVNPNPFIFGTYISYELKSAGRLNISIFNSSGMLVKTLVNYKGGTEEKGEIYWDGAGPGGTALPAGIYFVRLTIDGKETETVKVVKE